MHLRQSSEWFCNRVFNISNNPLWNTFKGWLSPKGCKINEQSYYTLKLLASWYMILYVKLRKVLNVCLPCSDKKAQPQTLQTQAIVVRFQDFEEMPLCLYVHLCIWEGTVHVYMLKSCQWLKLLIRQTCMWTEIPTVLWEKTSGLVFIRAWA